MTSLKRKIQSNSQPVSLTSSSTSSTATKQIKMDVTVDKLKTQRQMNVSEDDIIRSRLLYEGDQGSDDKRISNMMKMFHKSIFDATTPFDETTVEKLLSSLYSVEHSYRMLKSTLKMDEQEQLCYAMKCRRNSENIKELRERIDADEIRLVDAKQKRLHLLEYDARAASINKLGTRRELRAQQALTLERKYYFEHLQQTFEANYQQRLKQIAVYMRPIFELDEILRQDAHEDLPAEGAPNESPVEQATTTPLTPTVKFERQRTNSDSSNASMDGDENNTTGRSKRAHRNHMNIISPSIFSANYQPQPLYSSENDLHGTSLINPLTLLSSSNIS